MRTGFLTMLCAVGLVSMPVLADGVPTALSVQPPTKTVGQGSSFTVDISITGVSDLYAWGFDLGFDPTLIAAIGITEGPFLATGGPTFFIPGIIDNVGGTISFNGDTLEGAIPGVNGGGVLATASFIAVAQGTSPINLFNTSLLDSNLGGIQADVTGGNVTVTAVPEPATWLLLAAGLTALGILNLRRALLANHE